MEVQRRRRLEAVISDLADGDIAALWALANEFNAELRSVARGRLLEIGRLDLANDEDLLAGLVIDIGELFIGTSWQADGGALPWVWARHAINRLVSDTAGHRAISFDAEVARVDSPAEPLIGFEQLAERLRHRGYQHPSAAAVALAARGDTGSSLGEFCAVNGIDPVQWRRAEAGELTTDQVEKLLTSPT